MTDDTPTLSPSLTLNDGRAMPQLGLGAFAMDDDAAAAAIKAAIGAGYRAVDTASFYDNETGVGRGIRDSGIARDALFVTTKLWNHEQGSDAALRAFEASLGRLGLEMVDLYLIHWPAPKQGLALDTWRALIRLRDEGRARSIGVSNFREADLRMIVEATGETPAVNQIELHPRFQQRALGALNAEMGIVTQAWSPLGKGTVLADPAIARIAVRHARTPAQVVLRWHVERGHAAIPKSADPVRMARNLAVFDFALDADDLAEIDALDSPGGRTGPDPNSFPG